MNYDTMTIESLADDCFEKSGYKINKADLENRIKHLCEKYHQDKLKNESLHLVSDICQCSNPVFKTYEYTNKPVCTKCRKL